MSTRRSMALPADDYERIVFGDREEKWPIWARVLVLSLCVIVGAACWVVGYYALYLLHGAIRP
ncbi:MAG: hypothetical protein GEU71_03525 [Actinobacteria bacterium]|nr:hypothetical protein [Actinomycetota bacterium]